MRLFNLMSLPLMPRFAGNSVLVLLLLAAVVVGCSGRHSVPKPYGYYRITLPEPAYRDTVYGPYRFEMSEYAVLSEHREPGENYWMDIRYPSLNASFHCSYKPVQSNLSDLTRDALEFVYKHAGQAHAIPEQSFSNPDERVYGVLFTLEGNTASPYQLFLTDSTRHFFRAAAYCNCRPNTDSLRPVLDYLEADMRHMVETFGWNYSVPR